MTETKKVSGWSMPFTPMIALFSLTTWFYFLTEFINAIGFVINLGYQVPMLKQIPYIYVPLGIDHPGAGKWLTDKIFDQVPVAEELQPLVISLILLSFFALPHSFFAREPIKRILGEASPGEISVYRSIYVFQATTALFLIQYCWQPLVPNQAPLWDFREN